MSRIIREAVSIFETAEPRLFEAESAELSPANHDSISLAGALALFSQSDSLADDDGVRIPLHRADSTGISGEYVLFDASSDPRSIALSVSETGERVTYSVDRIADSTVGDRLRFWTRSYEAPTDPKLVDPTAADAIEPVTASNPRSDDEMETFFRELYSFTEELREAAREEVREQYAERPDHHVRKANGGIPRTAPIGRTTGKDGEVFRLEVFSKSDEDRIDIPGKYDIYPGMEVLVDAADEDERGDPLPVEATVAEMRATSIGVTPTESADSAADGWATLQDAEKRNVDLQVIGLLNPVPFDRERTATETAEKTADKRTILQGARRLEFAPSGSRTIPTDGLNEYQREAVERALRARNVFCIHGPPGTGKTRTLRAIIRAAVREGNHVLACAHSNQAVDNLVAGDSLPDDPDPDSLHADALDGTLSIARVGNHTRHPVVEQYTEKRPGRSDVVAATTNMVSDFHRNQFDIAVLDEATQASIPASLVPFNASKTMILAGDHKQLPPFASDELRTHEMHISLFEHLIETYGDRSTTLLRRQYRMNEAIAEFSNEAFYDGELSHGTANRGWTIDDFDPVSAYDVRGEEVRTRSKSLRNEAEIDIVIDEIERLLDARVAPGDIGVITPYGGQVGAIKRRLGQFDRDTSGLKVDTIDSFQGGEREAIIVSFVRSNDRGRVGFLGYPDEGPRRLNVALTRARKRLVVIGDWRTLTGDGSDRANDTDALYRRLYERLRDIDAFDRAVHDPPQ